jgi:apolipoprotein D and lipocalin family protein
MTMQSRLRTARASLLAATVTLAACAGGSAREPMPAVERVDLERFMGQWYVIANIPTLIEKGAHNAVESYRLDSDGSIATTFTFRKGGFDGEKKMLTPRAYVRDTESKAVWGMQFIWPFEADYRIVHLDEDYTRTIIGRERRDYVWSMARTPSISGAEYERLVSIVEDLGYDTTVLERVPQRW